MTDHLGGVSIAGGQMKTDYGWYNGGNGTNSSGFQVCRAATTATLVTSTSLEKCPMAPMHGSMLTLSVKAARCVRDLPSGGCEL